MVSSALVTLAVLAIQTLALLLLTRIVPGLQVISWWNALVAVVCIGLVNGLLWPTFIRLIQHFNLILFVVLNLALNGGCVFLVAAILPGVAVDSLCTAFVVTIGLTAATLIFTSLFAFHDADYYTRFVIKRVVSSGQAQR